MLHRIVHIIVDLIMHHLNYVSSSFVKLYVIHAYVYVNNTHMYVHVNNVHMYVHVNDVHVYTCAHVSRCHQEGAVAVFELEMTTAIYTIHSHNMWSSAA